MLFPVTFVCSLTALLAEQINSVPVAQSHCTMTDDCTDLFPHISSPELISLRIELLDKGQSSSI